MSAFKTTVFSGLLLLLLLCAGSALGQAFDSPYAPAPRLFVPHAAIDPVSGDLLVISNTWREVRQDLRRFHSDGDSVDDFVLQRYESCCAIHPSLVAVDSEGSIYTIEFTGELVPFYMYKHAPNGELDIDWGRKSGFTPLLSSPSGGDYAGGGLDFSEDEPEEEDPPTGFEEGETTLLWNAGGGRLEFEFRDPIDILPLDDGSVLVLDRVLRYVFRIAPDGKSVSEFIGKRGYIPDRPQRLLQDSRGYLYMVDYHDSYDIIYEGSIGVFRFTPDGDWDSGWGEGAGSINDPYRPTMDYETFVIDGNDILIALGGPATYGNHETVYRFDTANGAELGHDRVQFRLGYDETFLGMLGNPEGGFIHLEGRDFAVLVNFYTADGNLEEQLRISDLYSAD